MGRVVHVSFIIIIIIIIITRIIIIIIIIFYFFYSVDSKASSGYVHVLQYIGTDGHYVVVRRNDREQRRESRRPYM